MNEEQRATGEEVHRKFAVDLFNLVWDLLDKEERTIEEDDKMVHAAHASRYHWGEIGTALEFERGEWQISRAYAVLNRPESALYHAQRCLTICTENEFGDFDLALAYEAMARAYAIAGDQSSCRQYVERAQEAGEQIAEKDDRDYFLSELDSVICSDK